MKGKVKTLMFNDLVGYKSDMAVYPVTSVLGVLDEDNTNLKTIIANLKEEIKNKADSNSSSSTTTSFVPVIIRTSLANPSTPIGGSYNYATKTLTPPTGWEEGGITSTTTYLCIGVANSDTSVISWSEPYSSTSLKGEKGDKGDKGEKGDKGDTGAQGPAGSSSSSGSGSGSSGTSTTSEDVVTLFAYKHSDSKPSAPSDATYDSSTKTLTLLGGWQESTAGLEKPIYLSIGIWRSTTNKIEWQTPFLVFGDSSDLPFDEVPQSNYATTYCYSISTTLPDKPEDNTGNYSFESEALTSAPENWQINKPSTAPYYMSIGTVKKDANNNDKITITWSQPIIVASTDSLGPGNTPGTDNLTEIHVVIAYQNSTTTPTTPKATEGSVDFTTNPYTVTAPSGWFVEEDDDHKITDDTWCTIKKFQYKKNDDGTNAYATSNNSVEWSTPEKVSDAVLSLSKKEIDLVVGKMSVTANEMKTAVGNWVVTGDNLKTIAQSVVETTNFYSLTAGEIQWNAEKANLIAEALSVNTNFLNVQVQNTTGEIVGKLKLDEDGIMTLFSKGFVAAVKADKENEDEDSAINLIAKASSGDVAAQLSVGTNSAGASFIDAVAGKIDFTSSESFKSTVVNALEGNFSTILQKDGVISTIVGTLDSEGNPTTEGTLISEIRQSPKMISFIAAQVDITGTLNTQDIAVGNGTSKFFADGSGFVANKNIIWDVNGNTTIKGNINGEVTMTLMNSTPHICSSKDTSSNVLDLSKVDKSYLYVSIPDSTTNKLYIKLPDFNTFKYHGDTISIYVDYNVNSKTLAPDSLTYLKVTDDVKVYANCDFTWYVQTDDDTTKYNATRMIKVQSGEVLLQNGFLYTFINIYGTWKLINQTLYFTDQAPFDYSL